MDRVCQELRDQIVQLVEGDLGRAVADRLRAHAAACDACAQELGREERLVRLLRTPVAVPDACIALPAAELRPRYPLRSLRRLRRAITTRRLAAVMALAAAAAAVIVVAVGLRGGRPGGGSPPAESPDGTPVARHADAHRLVRIRTIVDSTADAPLPGDDLLALTAGVEAVVMRRPAQGR